jgi:MbtH protein
MDRDSPTPRDRIFEVVVNEEEQYSLWPAQRPLPKGWLKGGCTGSKEECLRFIETAWTDMRPKTLRSTSEAK